MTVFQKTKSFPINQLNELENTASTLLIPANMMEALNQKILVHKNLAAYLEHLLLICKIFSHSGMLPDPKKIKTEYQEEGLDLQRVNFRAQNADWIELGELALGFGKSRCFVFTFLLKLDLLGFWDTLSKFGMDSAVPTTAKLQLRVSWSLRRSFDIFARNYYVRV